MIHTKPLTWRRDAADLLREARRDSDGWVPNVRLKNGQAARSSWRTFQVARNSAARMSARAALEGRAEDAYSWAQVFSLLESRMVWALGLPAQHLAAMSRG